MHLHRLTFKVQMRFGAISICIEPFFLFNCVLLAHSHVSVCVRAFYHHLYTAEPKTDLNVKGEKCNLHP